MKDLKEFLSERTLKGIAQPLQGIHPLHDTIYIQITADAESETVEIVSEGRVESAQGERYLKKYNVLREITLNPSKIKRSFK